MTTVYKFKAYYTDSGVGTVQDPAPVCTVINMADDSKLADAQATTASTNMPGLYSYEYSGADGLDCVAWFKTTDTGCDVKELASYVSEKITTNLNADVAGVETKLDTVDTNVDAILADTGTNGVKIASAQTVATVTNLTNLPTMPTDWVTAAGLKADAVTEIQSGLATAAALDAVDNFIDTEVAAILAAVDTEVAAIKAKTDNLPASPAAVGSAMTLTAAYDKAKDDVLTPLGVVDGIVDAIKVQTDKIPATPASAGEYTAAIAAIQSDLDNPAQYKADVSGLATQASVNEIPTTPLLAANYTAPDNASIAAILEDTGTTIPATLATIDNEIAIIDGNVDSVLDDTGTSGVLLSTSALTSIFDDEVIVGSYNFSDLLKIMASALAGKLSGGGTTTLTFRGVDDTSDVIVTTVDANKNRTNVVITV